MLIVCLTKSTNFHLDSFSAIAAATAYAAAPAPTAYVQPAQTTYVAAAPRAPTYEAYPTSHTTPQYAYATRTQVVVCYHLGWPFHFFKLFSVHISPLFVIFIFLIN